ncbi:MAG: PSD1 and planctomycete cytochrome C domain-containing protein [Prosthecobacter sp.]|nr:PSD1 and planctomycete cytochrome C domain-containing protein [Prosthecobacter sp.]
MKAPWLIAGWALTSLAHGDEAGIAFFEAKIRPVLTAECYDCHHVQKSRGGLALDHRPGWLKGGDSGPAIVPGDPEASLLMHTIRHEDPDLKMPAKAPKLSDQVIADFANWIRMGAPDPRDTPRAKTAEKKPAWPTVMHERASWWCFQPLAKAKLPPMPLHQAIDFHIRNKLDTAGLPPAPRASKGILIRRLHYALTGLPPTPEEVASFVADQAPDAWERRVDATLASFSFGEHWARHWMDVVHYSETNGSESDALIPFAWRYRDYLIRAFNADVPYDQLVREHIAGDQLPLPRKNSASGINESMIGTAFWRFVEFYHTPVDVKREEVAVIDCQIDTFGKTFQALTISCARCHDHKFDPISDEDFYALYGMLASTRSALRIVDEETDFVRHNTELLALKDRLRPALAAQWLAELNEWPRQIKTAGEWLRTEEVPPLRAKPDSAKEKEIQARLPLDPWSRSMFQASRQKGHLLAPLAELVRNEDDAFAATWATLAKQARPAAQGSPVFADFRDGGLAGWMLTGIGLPQQGQTKAGGLSIHGEGSATTRAIFGRGYHTDVLSDRHAGSLRSPDFTIEHEVISVLARGDTARLRLVIENFQGDTVLFSSVNPEINSAAMCWHHLPIKPQWKGRKAYLELLTRDDKPNVNNVKEAESLEQRDGRSGFGIACVQFHSAAARPADAPALPATFWQTTPASFEKAMQTLKQTAEDAVTRWVNGQCDDADARLLSVLIENRLLDQPPVNGSAVATLAGTYRKLENTIPIARRVPGVFEDRRGQDAAFLPRGDHTKPEAAVPRRYLEVLHSRPADYAGVPSGRLQLANEITNPANPLTARVMVNRVWHWLFGQGLVATVDNFGRMGATPTHPELLDHLAREFSAHDWSLKWLIREMLLSQTWQRDSVPPAGAAERDANNLLWSHAQVRRMEAESIRDAMLKVSGALKTEAYGPSVRLYYQVAVDPDKQPPAGPLDGSGRRSLYLEVRRNFLSAFLLAFDFPKPVATAGKRSETNVPAQSLALLNDPFVTQQAQTWATRIRATIPDTDRRISRMYEEAFGRAPDEEERTRARAFIGTAKDDATAWTDLAHTMMNMKEMIYLR